MNFRYMSYFDNEFIIRIITNCPKDTVKMRFNLWMTLMRVASQRKELGPEGVEALDRDLYNSHKEFFASFLLNQGKETEYLLKLIRFMGYYVQDISNPEKIIAKTN